MIIQNYNEDGMWHELLQNKYLKIKHFPKLIRKVGTSLFDELINGSEGSIWTWKGST
jgi:hypothetical protein